MSKSVQELEAEIKKLTWELYQANCTLSQAWIFWNINKPWTIRTHNKIVWTLYHAYWRFRFSIRSHNV
jgi:hypothetical protein